MMQPAEARSERITFLANPSFKRELTDRARASGVSVGEYIRRTVDRGDELTKEQEEELKILVEQVSQAVPQMAATLDRMHEQLQRTNHEVRLLIDDMESRR